MVKFNFEDPYEGLPPKQIVFKIKEDIDKEIFDGIEQLCNEQRSNRQSIMRTLLTFALDSYEEHAKKIGE